MKLANSVDEFTSCLLDPLKTNTEARHAFGDSLDYLVDAGINLEQKKVIQSLFSALQRYAEDTVRLTEWMTIVM